MTAEINTAKLKSESVRAALTDWFKKNGVSAVSFSENLRPHVERGEDYRVVYEASFEPSELTQGKINIWLTEDGFISVGLDTRDRIARRLGTEQRDKARVFAAGHEPADVSLGGLVALLDSVANGEMYISAKIGLFGIGKMQAIMSSEDRDDLSARGYGYVGWIGALEKVSVKEKKNLIQLHSWKLEAPVDK